MTYNGHTGSRFFAALRMTGTLLAALCLAGCAKSIILDDGESSIPMQFGVYSARSAEATKADDSYVAPGVTTLPSGSSFGVFAYYQEGVVGTSTAHWTDGGRTPDFMFAQQVSFDGAAYSYSPIRYWPANEENTISFWAYYPYGAYSTDNTGTLKFYSDAACTSAYTASSTGLPVVEYTVDHDPANQKDIMFAALQQDKTYYNTTDGIVPFTFRHALALVDFVLAEGTNAQITSFNVSDLYWKGTCGNPGASPLVWTGQTSAGNFSIADVTLSGSSTIARLIMMPQTLQASAELSISYDIHFASYDPSHPEDIVYAGNSGSALLSTAGITEWQPGKHYVYNISAGFERIEFESAGTTDWTIGNDNIIVN